MTDDTLTGARLVEAGARAACVAAGVDPDRVCHGLGNLMPDGWTGPAWQVQAARTRAAFRAQAKAAGVTAAMLNDAVQDLTYYALHDEVVAPLCALAEVLRHE